MYSVKSFKPGGVRIIPVPPETTGSGDPDQTLRLLWRDQVPPPRRRGPRPSHSVDDVVAAAIELADAEGMEAVTIRAVATRLGISPMSVYTHVPGKAELLDLMLDGLYLAMPRPPWRSRRWRTRLTAVVVANRDLFRAHPWLTELASLSRPPLGPGQLAKYEHELAAFDGTGLDDVQIDATLTLLLGFAQQQTRAEYAAARQSAVSGTSDEQWWETNGPLLAQVIDASTYPRATRIGEAAGAAQGSAYSPDRAWAFGLARLLDGIGALIDLDDAG